MRIGVIGAGAMGRAFAPRPSLERALAEAERSRIGEYRAVRSRAQRPVRYGAASAAWLAVSLPWTNQKDGER